MRGGPGDLARFESLQEQPHGLHAMRLPRPDILLLPARRHGETFAPQLFDIPHDRPQACLR